MTWLEARGDRWRLHVWRGLVVLLVGVLTVVMSPAVSAHDVVVRSSPADGGTVTEFPRTIELEFSGIPQPQFNTVAVTNADTGTLLFRGTPQLDQQFVRLDVPADVRPHDGHYVVGFQITSSDGHATRGKTTFQVAATAAPPEEGSPDPSLAPSKPVDSSNKASLLPRVALAVCAGIVICSALVVVVRRRRARSSSPMENSRKGHKS